MLNKNHLSAACLVMLSLSACKSTNQSIVLKSDIEPVMQLTTDAMFDAKQPLLNAKEFNHVVGYLSSATDTTAVNQLLYFLRAYSYFGQSTIFQ